MSGQDVRGPQGTAAQAVPGGVSKTPEEGDVRVPIEVDERQDGSTSATEMDEAAMVEAAKRAGEAAAEEELQVEQASKLADTEAARAELQDQLSDAHDQIDAAQKEATEAKNRLLRLQADWDNYRRRTAQERLNERERAAERLVVSLLPVLDDMERAIEHVDKSKTTDSVDAQFVAGIQAVHDKMVDVLGKYGVTVINPVGEAFDPLQHRAVGRVEDKKAFNDTIAAVYQRGYRMGGKVIREAMVQVTYGGPKRPLDGEPENSDKAGKADK